MFKRFVLLRAKGGGAVCQGPSVEHGMHHAFANSKHTHFLILQVKKVSNSKLMHIYTCKYEISTTFKRMWIMY